MATTKPAHMTVAITEARYEAAALRNQAMKQAGRRVGKPPLDMQQRVSAHPVIKAPALSSMGIHGGVSTKKRSQASKNDKRSDGQAEALPSIRWPQARGPCWAGKPQLLKFDFEKARSTSATDPTPTAAPKSGVCSYPTVAPSGATCAAFWGPAQPACEHGPRRHVRMVMVLKSTPAIELIRHIEYHLLLGVDQITYFDNSCGDDTIHRTLRPYIRAGFASYSSKLQCLDTFKLAQQVPPCYRGATGFASLLLNAMPELQPPWGSLVWPIDDDEYVGIEGGGLHELVDEMHARRVSHGVVRWRLFGHANRTCTPKGPLVHTQVQRAPLDWEKRPVGSKENEILPSNYGKPIYLWGVDCTLNCSTHVCENHIDQLKPAGNKRPSYWRRDCKPGRYQPGGGDPADCLADLDTRVTLAHYRFQSLEHWKAKSVRGAISVHQDRECAECDIPPFFSQVHDSSLSAQLDARIAATQHAPLRACLSALFAKEHSAAYGKAAGSEETLHGRVVLQKYAERGFKTAHRAGISAAAKQTEQKEVAQDRLAMAGKMRCNTAPPACEATLPVRQREPPSGVTPLIFFHFRNMVGGSGLRSLLATAAVQLRLTHFIPCHDRAPGSWLSWMTNYSRLHLSSCVTYHLDPILARPSNVVGPAIYAGHFPFDMGARTLARGWSLKARTEQPAASAKFSCVMLIRDPISRFRECYVEHYSREFGHRPLPSLTMPELSDVLNATDGLYSCTNEIVRWVAPTAGWGEASLRRAGLTLSEEALDETLHRMDQCVIGNMGDRCQTTVALLVHWYPWLSGVHGIHDLCRGALKMMASDQNVREEATPLDSVRRLTEEHAKLQLPMWQKAMITQSNLQEVELYKHGMRRFQLLVACMESSLRGANHTPSTRRGGGAAHMPSSSSPSRTYPKLLPANCIVDHRMIGPRVAIAFYGLARGVSVVISSIRSNLLAPLHNASRGRMDVFVNLMQPSFLSNARTNESGVVGARTTSTALIEALTPCGFEISAQDAVDAELMAPVRRAFDVAGSSDDVLATLIRKRYNEQTMFNLFRSRFSMRRAVMLVAAHMRTYGVEYTHLCLARPDLLYVTPLLWRPGTSAAAISVPSWGHEYCPHTKSSMRLQAPRGAAEFCSFPGVNDRFSIGELGALLPLALDWLADLSRFSIQRNSEALWCERLAAAKVTVGLIDQLDLRRVRMNGNTDPGDANSPAIAAPFGCMRQRGLRLVTDEWNTVMAHDYMAADRRFKETCAVCTAEPNQNSSATAAERLIV